MTGSKKKTKKRITRKKSSSKSKTKRKTRAKKSTSKKEKLEPVSKTKPMTPEEEAEVLKDQVQEQIDDELPSSFQIMDAEVKDKSTYYVWVRGEKKYPKLKFTCVDESEAIRQYRLVISVENPTRKNFGVEKFEKE